jgi:hypothetical protein
VESLENRCSPEEAARRIASAKVAIAEMFRSKAEVVAPVQESIE